MAKCSRGHEYGGFCGSERRIGSIACICSAEAKSKCLHETAQCMQWIKTKVDRLMVNDSNQI
jgi:hypothetical protein